MTLMLILIGVICRFDNNLLTLNNCIVIIIIFYFSILKSPAPNDNNHKTLYTHMCINIYSV